MKDYFKFDTTPVNPNPPIPKEIERAAVQYKKDGEMESVGPFKVVTSNQYYYHCNYFDKEKVGPVGYLIIRSDGVVPSYTEAKRPKEIFHEMELILQSFIGNAHFAGIPTFPLEQLDRKLEKIRKNLDEPIPLDIQQSFEKVQSIPKTIIEKTKMIRCTVVEMQKLYKEMTVQYVISEDLLKKAQDLHNRLMVSLFYSFDARISTQQDIKKFLDYLSPKVSITTPSFLWNYLQLKFLLPFITKAENESLENFERLREMINMGIKKWNEQVFKNVHKDLRNPDQ